MFRRTSRQPLLLCITQAGKIDSPADIPRRYLYSVNAGCQAYCQIGGWFRETDTTNNTILTIAVDPLPIPYYPSQANGAKATGSWPPTRPLRPMSPGITTGSERRNHPAVVWPCRALQPSQRCQDGSLALVYTKFVKKMLCDIPSRAHAKMS